MQVSIQSPDAEENDRIAGNRSFEKKVAAARAASELDFPLTINCVLHRQNLDRIEELLELTLELGAQRLELANTQYYGWAVVNQDALMPIRRAAAARGGGGGALPRPGRSARSTCCGCSPTCYEDLPKPCMGGWGRTAMVVAPNGDVLPCQAASTIPGLEFANVREHPLEWIWNESDAFTRFRGTGLDAGAVPLVPARTPGGGLGRVPLPGAPADRRRGGHGSRSAGSRHTTIRSYRSASRRRPTSSCIAR